MPKKKVSQNVPAGEWVNVPVGQRIAIGTYVDVMGVLRASSDDSVVTNHVRQRKCQRKGIQPAEIVYDDNLAPWCPECWKWMEDNNAFPNTGK